MLSGQDSMGSKTGAHCWSPIGAAIGSVLMSHPPVMV